MVHTHFSTGSQRVHRVSQLLAHEGTYGEISQMSRSQRVSRQTLYTWKEKGQRALEAALVPNTPQVRVAKPIDLQRAVLTLLVEGHASYRGIQACLAVLLGKPSEPGNDNGSRAKGRTACASVAGAASFWGGACAGVGRTVQQQTRRSVPQCRRCPQFASVGEPASCGRGWGELDLALWYLQEQGVVATRTVSDGGRAIQEALRATKAISTHQRDVWHLLHLAGQVQARLERVVQEEEERWQLLERQEQQRATTGKKTAGRPAKTTADEQEPLLSQLHRVLDGVRYLFAQLRQLLEIVVLSEAREPRLLCYESRRGEVETVLDLLEEVVQSAPATVQKEVQRVSKQVRLALPALLHFAAEMEASQQEAIAQLGELAVGLIGWAWQRRAILGEQPKQLLDAMDPAWRVQAGRLLGGWSLAVRASSAVENWHSIVRPHLAVHRSLSAGMLALLAVWHNHRVAPRGLHQGQSPLQRSGRTKEANDWLVALGYPPVLETRRPLILKYEEELVA